MTKLDWLEEMHQAIGGDIQTLSAGGGYYAVRIVIWPPPWEFTSDAELNVLAENRALELVAAALEDCGFAGMGSVTREDCVLLSTSITLAAGETPTEMHEELTLALRHRLSRPIKVRSHWAAVVDWDGVFGDEFDAEANPLGVPPLPGL